MVNKNKTKSGIKLMKQNNFNFKNIILNKKLQKEGKVSIKIDSFGPPSRIRI